MKSFLVQLQALATTLIKLVTLLKKGLPHRRFAVNFDKLLQEDVSGCFCDFARFSLHINAIIINKVNFLKFKVSESR